MDPEVSRYEISLRELLDQQKEEELNAAYERHYPVFDEDSPMTWVKYCRATFVEAISQQEPKSLTQQISSDESIGDQSNDQKFISRKVSFNDEEILSSLDAAGATQSSMSPSEQNIFNSTSIPQQQQLAVCRFPIKVVEMLRNPLLRNIIKYDEKLSAIVLIDHKRLAEDILPHEFKNASKDHFKLFHRQLNHYGFKTLRRSKFNCSAADFSVNAHHITMFKNPQVTKIDDILHLRPQRLRRGDNKHSTSNIKEQNDRQASTREIKQIPPHSPQFSPVQTQRLHVSSPQTIQAAKMYHRN
mmetsp:Transcript_4608/g.6935  ORF Transcript_4608/g.6935 Transcript_4608/m.6935 type:complete len:300 (-) Transcript_4608:2282-3181(-)